MLNAAKNTSHIKIASNKSCRELNFLQQTWWTHISIYLRSEGRGHQRFDIFEVQRYVHAMPRGTQHSAARPRDES